jgi:hypothetical protein
MCSYVSLIKFFRTTFKKLHPAMSFIGFLFLSFIYLHLFINVENAFPGQATLSWEPPATNIDGTPLDDLVGYKIYYGTLSGNYTEDIDVGNVTEYTIDNLTDGITYYFVATAYDISGNESGYSNEVNKLISSSLLVQQYSLTIYRGGTSTGTGVVTSSPSGINCGSDCTEAYNAGTIVTLTATPAASSIFAGWSDGVCSGTGQCVITMNSDINVTASFTLKTYTITATAGTGGSISPFGSVSVNHGSNQTFNITPNTGYVIADVKVDGVSVGVVSTYTFSSVTGSHTIEANFTGKKIQCGDVNNDGFIDVVDALMVARRTAKLQVSNFTSEAGDINCDGIIDIIDALFISRKIAGLTVSHWCCK